MGQCPVNSDSAGDASRQYGLPMVREGQAILGREHRDTITTALAAPTVHTASVRRILPIASAWDVEHRQRSDGNG